MTLKISLLFSIFSIFCGLMKAVHLHRHYLPPKLGQQDPFLQTPLMQYLPPSPPPPSSQRNYNFQPPTPIPILSQEYISHDKGKYNFNFKTANGIRRSERGYLNTIGTRHEQVIEGSYSYVGTDGMEYTVKYKADGNGFQATGLHLPTPPPIPRDIAKSLALHRRGHYDDAGNYQRVSTDTPSNHYLPPPTQQYGQKQGYTY